MARRGAKPGAFEEPKQARTREQLARILEVAEELFAERGYAATKIADIAEAVPCSMSTIYDRFGGKAELLRYMHRKGAEEAVAMVDALEPTADATGDLREELPDALRAGLAVFERYRGQRRAVLERMHEDAELAELEQQMMRGLLDAGTKLLLAYRAQFTHPDPELAATQAMRLAMAMTEQRANLAPALGGHDLDEDRFVDEVVRMVLAYLGVDPRD